MRVIPLLLLLLLPASLESQTRSDSIAFLHAAYETAFRNGLHTAHAGDTTMVVCVSPPSDSTVRDMVLALLRQSRTLLIRDNAHCATDCNIDRRGSLVYDTLTKKRGIRIGVSRVAWQDDGSVSFETSYYEGVLSSAGFSCKAIRRPNGWEIDRCQMLWIS